MGGETIGFVFQISVSTSVKNVDLLRIAALSLRIVLALGSSIGLAFSTTLLEDSALG